VLYPTRSLEETLWRLDRADKIMGKSWWEMNCQQATNFVVGIPNRLLA